MQTTAKSLYAFFIALALVLAFIPSFAFADEVNGARSSEKEAPTGALLETTDDPQAENSYRYYEGQRLTSKDGAATESGGLSTFSAIKNPEGFMVFDWFDKFSKGYYTGTNAYKGVDVSEHNGIIDWKKVKASGVNYAIIRCGYGQNSTSQDDKRWITNVKGCIENGIPFGVYLYSYATDATKAASEADHVLRCLKDAGLTPNKVGYPIYFDMEDATTANSDHAAMATAFCNKIEKAGYIPGIYANKTWFNSKLTAPCFNKWTKWCAEWNASVGLTYAGLSRFTSGDGMWQFSDYGTVPGINGHAVDLNYTFMKAKNNVGFAVVTSSGMVRNVTGKALSPSVSVKLDGKTLKAGTDFTLSYKKKGSSTSTTSAPTEAGTYEVTVHGAGSYSGLRSLGDMVVYAKPDFNEKSSYRLIPSANKNVVLDASGKTPAQGANVSVWTSNNGNNQQWYIVPDGKGYYSIKNAANQAYILDASGATPNSGANITVWKNNSGLNQKWILVSKDGAYLIKNAANPSLVLSATGSSPQNGANVTVSTSTGAKNQLWQLAEGKDSVLTTTPVASKDISKASVSASGMARNATGKALAPTVTVTYGGTKLAQGTDYYLTYDGSSSAPSKAGKYTVRVVGKGDYAGTKAVGTYELFQGPDVSSNAQVHIASVSNSKFVLDAAGKSTRIGANVSIWDNNGGKNQMWYLVPDGNGYYSIKSAYDKNFVLDAAGAKPKKGSNISIWTSNGGNNQKWTIEPTSNSGGTYVIRNAANRDLVLDAAGASPSRGANVSTWTNNGGKNQQWKILTNSTAAFDSGKTYEISSVANSKYVLDAAGAKPSIGANISIWTKNGGKNQKWHLVSAGNGYYYIKSASNSAYVLDAAGAKPGKGSNISIWKNNGGANQKWKIEKQSDGSYIIRSAANNNLVLDASGKTPRIGANVSAWTSNGGSNQRWHIKVA